MRITLKTVGAIFIVLVMTIVTLHSALAVTGGCQGFDTSMLNLDPNASGTKYFGTMVIYTYDSTGGLINPFLLFVRIGNGGSEQAFGGTLSGVTDPSDFTDLTNAVTTFFTNTVVPNLCPTCNGAPFAFKAVTDVIQSGNGLGFYALDFTLAVQQ